jgi:hypothetical protein
VSSGDGASSTIFWWRRCREHSRSPKCTTWCRGCRRAPGSRCGAGCARSARRARVVAERVARLAAGRGDRVGETRLVVDEPHALAAAAGRRLEQHREADLARRRGEGVVVEPRPDEPGTTLTPAAATVALAAILSPIASIAATGGPTNTMPCSAQAAASAGFSDRKP